MASLEYMLYKNHEDMLLPKRLRVGNTLTKFLHPIPDPHRKFYIASVIPVGEDPTVVYIIEGSWDEYGDANEACRAFVAEHNVNREDYTEGILDGSRT